MSTLEDIGAAALVWQEKAAAKNRAQKARAKELSDYCDGEYYDRGSGESPEVEAAFKATDDAIKECRKARGALIRAINKHRKDQQ